MYTKIDILSWKLTFSRTNRVKKKRRFNSKASIDESDRESKHHRKERRAERIVLVNVTASWKTTYFPIKLSFIFHWFINTCKDIMKPAVDEMFPEGAGPYVDLDEVGVYIFLCDSLYIYICKCTCLYIIKQVYVLFD